MTFRDRLPDVDLSVRGALATLAAVLWYPFGLLMRVVGWFGRQARGLASNTRRAYQWFAFDRILPPSIVDALQFLIDNVPKLLGLRGTSPWQQVGAAVSLLGVALLATVVSGGLLIGVAVVVVGFGVVGLFRFVPWFNEQYNDLTAALPIKRDYDLRGWRRD